MDKYTGTIVLGIVLAGTVATMAITIKNTQPKEEYTEVEYLPLNGEFSCTYHKASVMHVPDVVNFSVTDAQAGWNWSLELKDGSVLFFTQGTDKLCFITHVEEEDNVQQ